MKFAVRYPQRLKENTREGQWAVEDERQIVKPFSDGSHLEYGKGQFDDWCVYLVSPDGARVAPRDIDCFKVLKVLAAKHGVERLYKDYVSLYEVTGKAVEEKVLQQIAALAAAYPPEARLRADKLFTILYMAMIAEEHKAGTRLGKRIKRLGVHRLLVESAGAQNAARFLDGRRAEAIALLCEERGF